MKKNIITKTNRPVVDKENFQSLQTALKENKCSLNDLLRLKNMSFDDLLAQNKWSEDAKMAFNLQYNYEYSLNEAITHEEFLIESGILETLMIKSELVDKQTLLDASKKSLSPKLDSTVNSIIYHLKDGTYPENTPINLRDISLSSDDVKALFSALRSKKAPDALCITLGSLSEESFIRMSKSLKLPLTPKKLQINFNISAPIVKTQIQNLSDALKSKFLPPELALCIRCINLDSSGAQILADTLLNSASSPQKLTLMLNQKVNHRSRVTPIDSVGAIGIATALKSNHTLQDFTLDLTNNHVGDIGTSALANAILSAKNIKTLQLYLGNNEIGDQGLIALATALKSSVHLQALTLSLEENKLTDKGTSALANAILSAKNIKTLQLYLGNNQIGDLGLIALATALESSDHLQALTLSLEENIFHFDGLSAISNTLKSGNLPQQTQLNLSSNNLTGRDIRLLTNTLKSGGAPEKLHLVMKNTEMNDSVAIKVLLDTLISQTSTRHLTIDLTGSLKIDQVTVFIEAIGAGKIPYETQILGYPRITQALNSYREQYDILAFQAAWTMLLRNKKPEKDGLRLMDEVVSVILSFLHPKGETFAQNTYSFFGMRTTICNHSNDSNKTFLNNITSSKHFQIRIQVREIIVRLLCAQNQDMLFPPDNAYEKHYEFLMELLSACKIIDQSPFASSAFPTLKIVSTSLIKLIKQDKFMNHKNKLIKDIVHFCQEAGTILKITQGKKERTREMEPSIMKNKTDLFINQEKNRGMLLEMINICSEILLIQLRKTSEPSAEPLVDCLVERLENCPAEDSSSIKQAVDLIVNALELIWPSIIDTAKTGVNPREVAQYFTNQCTRIIYEQAGIPIPSTQTSTPMNKKASQNAVKVVHVDRPLNDTTPASQVTQQQANQSPRQQEGMRPLLQVLQEQKTTLDELLNKNHLNIVKLFIQNHWSEEQINSLNEQFACEFSLDESLTYEAFLKKNHFLEKLTIKSSASTTFSFFDTHCATGSKESMDNSKPIPKTRVG